MIRVLLADDHQIFREGIKSLFAQQAGFSVVGMAENGQQAVALARELSPDVIVIDVSMPDLNGIEATRLIKQQRPESKILALSMYTERNFVLEMLKAGASGYLCKDDAFNELIKAIETVQAGKTYLPPALNRMLIQEFGQQTLSVRETEVLQLLAAGQNTKQVAELLFVSVKTVEAHRSNIFKKLELNNLADLTRYAIRSGLIEP